MFWDRFPFFRGQKGRRGSRCLIFFLWRWKEIFTLYFTSDVHDWTGVDMSKIGGIYVLLWVLFQCNKADCLQLIRTGTERRRIRHSKIILWKLCDAMWDSVTDTCSVICIYQQFAACHKSRKQIHLDVLRCPEEELHLTTYLGLLWTILTEIKELQGYLN